MGSSSRKDKRANSEHKAASAEQVVQRGSSEVCKITMELCKPNCEQNGPVKDRACKTITTERKQAARWMEHFQEVLNRPNNETPADLLPRSGA